MNGKTFAAAALLAAATAMVSAKPGGAPACAINAAKIEAGMGAPAGDRNFKIEASATEYEPGKPLTFKVVSGTAATKTHKGLLLYVEPASDAKKRVGAFTIPEGFKSNVDKCAAIQVAADTDSVITHNSPADKQLGAALTWMAPATAMGDLVVRAVVAGAGPKNWQILEPITLKAKGGNGYPTPAPPQQTGYPMPGNGQRKCKKWRKKTGAPMPTGTAPAPGDYPAPAPTAVPAPQEPGYPAPGSQGPTGGEAAPPAPPTDPATAAPVEAGSQAPTSADGTTSGASARGVSLVASMGAVVVAALALA